MEPVNGGSAAVRLSVGVAQGVWKAFGETQALRDVSLDVGAGECHGLVGRNGAGKSTLVAIFTGLIRPDRGLVRLGAEAAPALAEAAKNHWTMAVAIVAPGGTLIYFEKMDNTQIGSAEVAVDKARTAARFKRPTKAFQDALAAGGDGLRVLGLKDVTPVEGGIPLVMDGKIVGAIGVSGGSSAQDGQCAKLGADAVK